MSGDKGVVHAFARLGKAGDAAKLTQRGKLLPPPGEDLVTIALVSHVEHQPVAGRIKHAVDRHCQLHRA